MDIISYGIGNKAKSSEANLRNQVLATGVEGKSKNVKERIDNLEKYFDGLTAKANKLIVSDAVNIMKANARLNAVAKTTKYRMENMVFDDLLDASGIDAGKSSGYTHDTEFGFIQSNSAFACTIETVTEPLKSSPEKVILLAEEHKKETVAPKYGMSFNGTNSHIVIPGWKTGPSERTFTCEITVTLSSDKDQCFVAYNQDNILCGYYKNKLQLRLTTHTLWGPPLEVGREYKLRFVIEKKSSISTLTIYVDGLSVATSTTMNMVTLNAISWSIGQEIDGSSLSDFVSGTLSDIRLWEKVADTVGTELSGDEEGLMLHYDFAENEDSIVIDKSKNKRDGQIVNATRVLIEGEAEPVPTEDPTYFISRDNGETWIPIVPEKLFYFENGTVPAGTQLKLKTIIPPGYKLSNYALTWA